MNKILTAPGVDLGAHQALGKEKKKQLEVMEKLEQAQLRMTYLNLLRDKIVTTTPEPVIEDKEKFEIFKAFKTGFEKTFSDIMGLPNAYVPNNEKVKFLFGLFSLTEFPADIPMISKNVRWLNQQISKLEELIPKLLKL